MSFSGSTFGRYSRLWLVITGVILLVIGIVMAVAFGGVPFAGGVMIMTGVIMGVVGAVLIVIGLIVGRRAGQVDQLLATGIPGSAQIVGMTQTGMYLNEQPQVELHLMVNIAGQPPYAVRHRSFVPLILLGRLSSGAPLAVRVDPANPQRIAVDWQTSGAIAPPTYVPTAAAPGMAGSAGSPYSGTASISPGSSVDESLGQVQAALAASGVAAAATFSQPGQENISVEQMRAHLRQSGLQATATIDHLQDTGQIVGDERLFVMDATLHVPGEAPRKLDRSGAMVPIISAHKIRQGMTVPVRYAAENPNALMFEWDQI